LKTGYDRRALPAWTGLAWVLLVVCFLLMPPPTPHPGLTPVNINYVYGTSDHAPQTLVPAVVWFIGLVVGLPLLAFVPTHFLLVRFMPEASSSGAA
jgi:hypothetical protein